MWPFSRLYCGICNISACELFDVTQHTACGKTISLVTVVGRPTAINNLLPDDPNLRQTMTEWVNGPAFEWIDEKNRFGKITPQECREGILERILTEIQRYFIPPKPLQKTEKTKKRTEGRGK